MREVVALEEQFVVGLLGERVGLPVAIDSREDPVAPDRPRGSQEWPRYR